jgi:hypothetical protein
MLTDAKNFRSYKEMEGRAGSDSVLKNSASEVVAQGTFLGELRNILASSLAANEEAMIKVSQAENKLEQRSSRMISEEVERGNKKFGEMLKQKFQHETGGLSSVIQQVMDESTEELNIVISAKWSSTTQINANFYTCE